MSAGSTLPWLRRPSWLAGWLASWLAGRLAGRLPRWSSLAHLVWPACCAACDRELASDDAVFCGDCAHTICQIGLACPGCGLPRLGGWAATRAACATCAERGFAFTRAFAAFEYGESLAAAIVRMKHGGHPELAPRLGRLLGRTLAQALGPEIGPRPDAVVPVPLHPRKLRRRGFNQALELARAALALQSGDEPPRLERHLLIRTRNTRELGHEGPGARRTEVAGGFGIARRGRVVGRRFVVVDDVMTTGATLGECAETLMRAGAAEVRVVALARATSPVDRDRPGRVRTKTPAT